MEKDGQEEVPKFDVEVEVLYSSLGSDIKATRNMGPENPNPNSIADETIESINKSLPSFDDSTFTTIPSPIQFRKRNRNRSRISTENLHVQWPRYIPVSTSNIIRGFHQRNRTGNINKSVKVPGRTFNGYNNLRTTTSRLFSPSFSSTPSPSPSDTPDSANSNNYDYQSHHQTDPTRSPYISAIKTARDLLQFAENMEMIRDLPPGQDHCHGNNDYNCQGSSMTVATVSAPVSAASKDGTLAKQESSVLTNNDAALEKIQSIIALAETFSQMEKEKIAIKKRKLTLIECHQKQIIDLERQKLDIEKEKLKHKRLKLVFLQSENLVPPTNNYTTRYFPPQGSSATDTDDDADMTNDDLGGSGFDYID